MVLPARPVKITLAAGRPALAKNIRIKVRNGDFLPVPEKPGHRIQLIARDGDCPPGTIVGPPDFDKRTPGAQDSVQLRGGKAKSAVVIIGVSRDQFTSFNRYSPWRCTLMFEARAEVTGNGDPTPENNFMPVELSVVDRNDAEQTTAHESVVLSLPPRTIRIRRGRTQRTRTVRARVRNADLLDTAGHAINLSVSAGDCPPGLVGLPDFGDSALDQQDTAPVGAGGMRVARLPLVIDASVFHTVNPRSPARCTALVTATGPAGDSNASNNTTKLVIDVVDRNDS